MAMLDGTELFPQTAGHSTVHVCTPARLKKWSESAKATVCGTLACAASCFAALTRPLLEQNRLLALQQGVGPHWRVSVTIRYKVNRAAVPGTHANTFHLKCQDHRIIL